jgi:hypothetical protein
MPRHKLILNLAILFLGSLGKILIFKWNYTKVFIFTGGFIATKESIQSIIN